MGPENEESYDERYEQYRHGGGDCAYSCDDPRKATQLVTQVARAFGLSRSFEGARLLDVGCGLGYISRAFQLAGATVTAVDFSPPAIAHARGLHPDIDARVLRFPDDLRDESTFDIIYARDFSLLNTNDVDRMEKAFFEPCDRVLRKNGILLVGWRSDFTGNVDSGNWTNWSHDTMAEMRTRFRLTGPRVTQIPTRVLSETVLLACRLVHRKIPFYFMKKAR